MDKNNQQEIERYLTQLGFEPEAASLYRTLIEHGPQTILEISRASGLERTRLYRLVDDLTAKGLIEEVLGHKTRIFKAADVSRIDQFVAKQARKVKQLQDSFTAFANAITRTQANLPTTNILYYRGVSGIRQILANELNMKREAVGFTYRVLQEPVGVKFFERWAQEFEEKKLKFRDIRSDEFMKSGQIAKYPSRHINGSTWRYLPDHILHLTHSMDIYDDVVAIYYWQRDELFGLEIHNQQIADTQKSMFEVFWQLAQKYEPQRLALRQKWNK